MTLRHDLYSNETAMSPKTGLAGFVAVAASYMRRFRNRREVIRLLEFSDSQLADIGLNRDDVRRATRGGAFDDHSGDLTIASLRRRVRIHRYG